MKYLLILLGFLFLGTGVVGIFVPLLPTTPFILLSAGCFIRSSGTLYNWLIGSRFFGKYIENYLRYKSITIRSKIVSIIILWLVLSASIITMNILWVRIMLVVIGICVTIHIIMIKTLR